MNRKTVIIVIAIVFAVALLFVMLPQNAIDAEGVIVSITVTETEDDVHNVIICMNVNEKTEKIYICITDKTTVVDTSGKKVASEYLREGDFIFVKFSKNQEEKRIKQAKKVVFDIQR